MAEEAKWYVVHTYSGYENTVATTIMKHVDNRNLHDLIHEVSIPMETVTEKHDIAEIRQMLTEHVAATGSPKAREILDHLDEKASCFKKILPRDYDRMLRTIAQLEEKGMNRDQAEVEAFYRNTKGGEQ